jgi:hypothetical protein
MNHTTKHAPIFAVAMGAVILLAGCTPAPTPTSSPSSAASSTPTPTAPTPDAVEAPTGSDEAYAAANRTIEQFAQVQYEIQAEGGADVGRIEPFAAGEALRTMQQIASDLSTQGLSVTGGAPGWEANASATTFGEVQPSTGPAIPNGIAYVKGCWDLSKQKTLATNGTPPADRAVTRFPVEFNVTYFPESKTWKVTNQTNITGDEGAPQC